MDVESVTSSDVSWDETLRGTDHNSSTNNSGAPSPPYETRETERPSHLETCKYWCVWACYAGKDVLLIGFAIIVAIGIVIVWPCILIYMGHKYLHECSYYPFIPIYLIINGVVVIGLAVFGPLVWWMDTEEDKWYHWIMKALVMIITIALMGCFILGNVVLAKLPSVWDAACNPTIWDFAQTAAIIWDVSPVPFMIIYIALKLTSCGKEYLPSC